MSARRQLLLAGAAVLVLHVGASAQPATELVIRGGMMFDPWSHEAEREHPDQRRSDRGHRGTGLDATVPAQLLSRVGTFPVVVWNPRPTAVRRGSDTSS